MKNKTVTIIQILNLISKASLQLIDQLNTLSKSTLDTTIEKLIVHKQITPDLNRNDNLVNKIEDNELYSKEEEELK